MTIVQYTQDALDKIKGKTSEERLKSMTEAELEAAAKSDPDNPLLTDDELKGFKPPSDEYRKRFQKDDTGSVDTKRD